MKPSLVLVLFVLVLFACGAGPGYPTDLQVGAHNAEQLQCDQTYSTRADIDKCRADSRAKFCAQYPATIYCRAAAMDGGAS